MGRGTYIRSLARDLGKFLGTVAYVSKLRRIRCGPFCQKDAISLATLSKSVLCAPPQEVLLSIATALDDIPALAVTETQPDICAMGARCGYEAAARSLLMRTSWAQFRRGCVVCYVGRKPGRSRSPRRRGNPANEGS